MKRLCFIWLTMLLTFKLFAQTTAPKQDMIVKANGDVLAGKITKITDADLQFIYTGETLEYTIKKGDILKIVYASGRTESFSQPPLPAEVRKNDQVSMTASPVDHHNKIAVLPFTFLMDNQPGSDQVGLKAQEDTYGFLSQHAAGYTVLDTRTSNALLVKAGATKDKIMGFTMKEICDILGVEYVIDGAVSQNKGYETSSTGGYSNSTIKRDDNNQFKGVNNYNSSNSNAAQRYDVSVSLHIYMDNHASIYNQSHKAFLSSTDASYSGPLEYLLKRCPLYRK